MANDNPTEQTREEINKEYEEKYETDNKSQPEPPKRSVETEAAFAYLSSLLKDDNSDTDKRIAAARAILDHAHL